MHIHHPVDFAVAALLRGQRMFSKGWGDEEVLRRLEDQPLFDQPPRVPDITWREQGVRKSKHGPVTICDGTFASPFTDLPEQISIAHVRLLSAPRNERAAVVIAGSREEGFGMRQSIYGPLVTGAGTDVLILESPFYGVRRLPALNTSSLPTVSQQILLNLALVEESRALAAWLLDRRYARVGVAGYSMGGTVAALVGATVDAPLALSVLAAGLSSAPVLTEHMLSWSVDYKALGESGRARLRRIVERVDLGQFPAPKAVHAAILLGCSRDGYIPAEQIRALHALWKGSELRWVHAGHISALFTQRRALRAAVGDSLDRLVPTA